MDRLHELTASACGIPIYRTSNFDDISQNLWDRLIADGSAKDPGLDPDLGCAEWLRRKILFLRRGPGGALKVADLLRELQEYEKVAHVDAVRKLRNLSSELCRGSAILNSAVLETWRLDPIWQALIPEECPAAVPMLNSKTECADWRCYRAMASHIPGHPGPGRVYTQTFGVEYFRGTAREFGRKSPAPNQGNGSPPQTSGGLPPPVQDLDKPDIPTLERILNGLQRP